MRECDVRETDRKEQEAIEEEGVQRCSDWTLSGRRAKQMGVVGLGGLHEDKYTRVKSEDAGPPSIPCHTTPNAGRVPNCIKLPFRENPMVHFWFLTAGFPCLRFRRHSVSQ